MFCRPCRHYTFNTFNCRYNGPSNALTIITPATYGTSTHLEFPAPRLTIVNAHSSMLVLDVPYESRYI